MEFLSAYNYRLSYRRGRDNANADFLFRLPIPPTAEDISGSYALTDPDDIGVCLIRACGYTTPSCPIPGVGLGGLTPPSHNNLGTGRNPFPTPVLGGLPLTKDDFRTHRAPMSPRRMAGPTIDTSVTPTNEPYLSDAIDDQLETSRPNRAGRTRSRTAILTGNTPLRSDYHRAACSGFATSAAPALPPKTPLRSSPLPRLDRLGSTIPLGRPDLCRPSPAPDPQMDPTPTASPVSNHTTPEYDACAAAEQLSNTLLSYRNRDWDKAQRADPLRAATRRYIQLGCPDPPSRSLCDNLASHTRPEIADITDLAAKGRLLEGDDDTILQFRKPITTDSTPNGHNSRRNRPPFDDPVRIYLPLLGRPWIMHACHAEASCHLGVTRTLKMLERFYWWVIWKSAPKGGYDAASSAGHGKPPAKPFDGLPSPSPCQTALEYPSALSFLDPCRPRPEETLTFSFSQIASAGGRTCSLSPPRSSQQKVPPTSWQTA